MARPKLTDSPSTKSHDMYTCHRPLRHDGYRCTHHSRVKELHMQILGPVICCPPSFGALPGRVAEVAGTEWLPEV